MKNFLLSSLAIVLFGCLSIWGMPWWSLALIAAVLAFIFPQNGAKSFAAGFVAGFALWFCVALFKDMANGSLFSSKIGQVFQGLSSYQLLYATGTLGGLLAALGALSGQWARDLFSPKKQSYYYNRRRSSGRYR
jgi:hypothetical protein